MGMIKVLRIEPGKAPEAVEIDNELESLQAEVGGLIQAIYPWDDMVCIILNEEGKLLGQKPNRALRDDDGRPCDIMVGTILIVGLSEEDDDFVSLTPGMMEKYERMFHFPEVFKSYNGRIGIYI